jgi:ferric-dicitrate binding protein FerR (iron transport regulator)
MDHHGIDSDFLARFIAGEADSAQRAAVEAWAAAAPENARELERMRSLWDLGADTQAVPEVNVEAAWARVESRIAEAEGKGRVVPLHRIRWQRWAAAAAVIVAVLVAARWIMQPAQERYAAIANPVKAMLADSSAIVLSPGTTLAARMGRQRSVTLKGEAYFAVRRDEERPFVIDAGDVRVTVLGTAFTVSAYDTSDIVEVRVRSGRVRMETGPDTLTLTAGQHARYRRSRHLLERAPAPPAEAWGWRILHFDRAPLDEVARQLERSYKVRLTFASASIARCALTAEFDDEPIEVILGVIADTFSLTLTRDGDRYVLNGEGC